VYYLFEYGEVIIIAVMHGKRNPKRWQRRA
jgi:plasmid stabilization system protein ParE